jgi:hypothetical protein
LRWVRFSGKVHYDPLAVVNPKFLQPSKSTLPDETTQGLRSGRERGVKSPVAKAMDKKPEALEAVQSVFLRSLKPVVRSSERRAERVRSGAQRSGARAVTHTRFVVPSGSVLTGVSVAPTCIR